MAIYFKHLSPTKKKIDTGELFFQILFFHKILCHLGCALLCALPIETGQKGRGEFISEDNFGKWILVFEASNFEPFSDLPPTLETIKKKTIRVDYVHIRD